MKVIFEDENYILRSAGFMGAVVALIKKDARPMNFTVRNKTTRSEFRLSNREQDALGNVAELMAAFWITPEMRDTGESSKERWRKAITRECIDAVVMCRAGDDTPLEKFASMKIDEFAVMYRPVIEAGEP
jgi:hypothetical protein